MSENPYVIYGLRLSYFTGKVEAALRWHDLPYRVESKTLLNKWNLEKRAGTHLIPVVITPENWAIWDSTPIISLLDARNPQRRLVPQGSLGALVRVLEEWFDEWVPRNALHYRWHYPETAALASRAIAREHVPFAPEMLLGRFARTVQDWGNRACRANGTSDPEQQKAAEAEMHRVYEALEAQLGETRYALGDRPTAVDAVLMGGFDAHFFPDPAPKRQLERYERVMRWIEQGKRWDGEGDLAPFPESTPFARAILREMGGAYKGFIEGNAKAQANKEKAFIATVVGEPVSFLSRAYPELSRRALCEFLQRHLSAPERAEVLAWLQQWELDSIFRADPDGSLR